MKQSISKKKLREFGLLIGFGFPIIFGLTIPIISGHLLRSWPLWVGFPSLLMAIIKPTLLYYPYKIWMKLGDALGWINSKVILGLVYFIILLPIAIIMRIFSYDPLRKRKSNEISFRENKLDKQVDFKRIF